MPPPLSQKSLKRFLGRVSYLHCFIPALAEIAMPFGNLLKGKASFQWNTEHAEAFKKIKAVLASAQTMVAP